MTKNSIGKLNDKKLETIGVGSGIACRMEAEISAYKAGAYEDLQASTLGKLRAVQVQSVTAQINDDKLSFRMAVADQSAPGIVAKTMKVSRERQVTRGLGDLVKG